MSQYEWLEKRKSRTVDNLRLWPENPRLNPEETHINLADYITDLFTENSERDSFNKLVDSIVSEGFIPADPIVVWKNTENNKYYVAEGNRRVLALKLLRNPEKAPLIIRNSFLKKAKLIDRNTIEKIRVNVAPSFEEAEWYINQRHAQSSILRPWSRLQQQRWISNLYDKHSGNIDHIMTITKLSKSELNNNFRILKIRDFASNDYVKSLVAAEELEKIQSHRMPMTILERWFLDTRVRRAWGIEFDEENVEITSNHKSFLRAYTKFLQLVINRSDPNVEIKIDTRTIDTNFDNILDVLPTVVFGDVDTEPSEESVSTEIDIESSSSSSEEGEGVSEEEESSDVSEASSSVPQHQNPKRLKLIISSVKLNTSNYKLNKIFSELKEIPLSRYPNSIAITLRVFLDIALGEFIRAEGVRDDIIKQYKKSQLSDVPLKYRLEYLKKNTFKKKTEAYKVVNKLINPANDYSLDTLNNYVHGSNTHHTSKRFINGFWDFLFPLLEEIIDIKEV